jgi:hypothetical protein
MPWHWGCHRAVASACRRTKASRYLNALGECSVAPSRSDRLNAFDVSLQDAPMSVECFGSRSSIVLGLRRLWPSRASLLGFVNSGALLAGLRRTGCHQGEQHGGFRFFSSTRLEQIAPVDHRPLGLPRGATGSPKIGTTVAHDGTAAARDALLDRMGWNAGADGLFGAPPITVIAAPKRTRRFGRSLDWRTRCQSSVDSQAHAGLMLPRSPGRRWCAFRRGT